MKTKPFSPLLSAANNIVKTKRPLSKRAKDYDAFVNWLGASNKDIKKIKLPKVKKVENLEFSVGMTGGGGGGGGILNLLLGGAAGGLGVRFLGKGINAVKGFGKNAISKIFPRVEIPAAKKAAIPAADLAKKGVVKGWEHIATGAPRAIATGTDDAAKIAAMKGGGKLATKGGELVSKLIPGLATVVNLGISGYRFSQGDIVGGSLSALSAIPILGWAAVGIDVAREFGAFEGTSLGLKQEKPKNKIETRLKEQERTQREAASASNVTFQSITDKFDKVVSKFEKFASGMGAAISGKPTSKASTEDKMTEYGEYGARDQSTSTTPGELQDLESTGGVLPSSIPKGDKFGYSSWRGRNHNGIDYPLPEGTPISVIQPGTVADAGFRNNGYGNQVKVNHPGGVSSFYAHLSSINVASGQKIDPGTVIGKIGSTGLSTGPHLHFEVDVNGKASNPEPYEDKLFRFGGNVKVKPKAGVSGKGSDPFVLELHADPNAKGQKTGLIPSNTSPDTAVSQALVSMFGTYGKNYRGGLGVTNRGGNMLESDMSLGAEVNARRIVEAMMKDPKRAYHIFAGHADVTKGETGAGGEKEYNLKTAELVERLAKAQKLNVEYHKSIITNKASDPNSNFSRIKAIMDDSKRPGISGAVVSAPTQLIPAAVVAAPLQTQTPGTVVLMGNMQPQVAARPSIVPVPIPMGGGQSSGGGVVVVSPSEDTILNSLWKTMLLTNLSAA